MQIGDQIRALFAPKPKTPNQNEQAWSETTIYASSDFPKYNPDDLMSRKGYGIYRKMMTDEQIKAVVRFKRDAITSRDYYFECDDELDDDLKEERIKFFECCVRGVRGSFLDALNGIMSAMYHGFSMTEKVYAVKDHEGSPRIMVDKLRLRPFDTFYFHVSPFGEIEKVEQKMEGKAQDIEPSKFIHYVQNPDYDEHYGSSELREAYRAWFSKDVTIRMFNIYLERMAAGFIWVAPKEGKTLSPQSQEYATLQQVLSNISTKTAMILPSGMELNVVHPSSTDAYERAISLADKSIAKALLVPNLMGISEQGQTGSYSQSQTQLEAFLWTLDADATRLEEILNEQLFKEIGDLNYGDGYYPRFKFKPVSDAKKFEIIKTWQALVSAKAVTASESDEAHLRMMLDFPEKEEALEQPETPSDTPQEPTEPPEDDQKQDETMDETVVGKDILKTSAKHDCGHDHKPRFSTAEAFSNAMKRVDFAVIGSKSDDSSEDASYQIAALNGDAVARMMKDAEVIGYDVDKVIELKYTASELGAIKKAVMSGLADGWKIGATHATKELRKADKQKFDRQFFEVTDRALTDIAGDFFKARGHKITGSISNQTQTIIQNTLLEGIKGSKAFADTKKAIYKALESEGLMTEEDIEEALGTVSVKDTKARIQTIMRTSTFEAINEARYQYFSDPALDGFVEALEYSAIMDDRTTEICSQLDGKTFALNSEEWQTYNPPNHYGCRSLLIPVTQNDTWTQSDAPTVMPQKGFGFDRAPYETSQGQVTVSPVINVQPPNVTIQVTMPEQQEPNVHFTAEVPASQVTVSPTIQAAPNESKERSIELTLPDGRVIKGSVK